MTKDEMSYKKKETDETAAKICEQKCEEIERFLKENECSESPRYIEQLRMFALSKGGLINDKIRKRVWPLLIGLEVNNLELPPNEEEMRKHAEFSQVVLDVNRSIKRFPPGIPYEQRIAMQDQLIRLILRVIMKHPQLQYYQGYHDVAITFLLVVGENVAYHIMEKLSNNHLKHFMEPTMEKTSELLDYIYPLLERCHSQLCDYLEKAEVGTMFSLPWFLTWYSHTLTKYEHVGRLYDYFLASEELIPLYLIPVIVIYRQEEIFLTECDMACLHHKLSKLPEDLPFDELLVEATKLYEKYPPDDIKKEVILRRNKRKIMQEQLLRSIKKPSKRNSQNRINHKGWEYLQRIILPWVVPHSKFHFLLISASFLVGLYAYYRYANTFETITNGYSL